MYSFPRKPIPHLPRITCHMGPQSLTCHPKQVKMPHLNPSQIGRCLIYLPGRDERLSWPWSWLYDKMVYVSTIHVLIIWSHPTGSQTQSFVAICFSKCLKNAKLKDEKPHFEIFKGKELKFWARMINSFLAICLLEICRKFAASVCRKIATSWIGYF